jgi:hypothetical protein
MTGDGSQRDSLRCLVAPTARLSEALLQDRGHYDRSMIARRAREQRGREALAHRWDGLYRELIAQRRASQSDGTP